MSDPDVEARGLAAERTTLAWDRTGLSFLALAGIAAKALPSHVALGARVALVTLATLLGVAAWVYGVVRDRPGSDRLAAIAPRVLTLGTALLAALALVLEVA